MPDDDLVGEEPLEPVQDKVETYGAETPVTGQTKMQAAWSADTGDEETSAGSIFRRARFLSKFTHLGKEHSTQDGCETGLYCAIIFLVYSRKVTGLGISQPGYSFSSS